MDLKFDDLKYLVKVVGVDLFRDDFSNFQDGNDNSILNLSDDSEVMYDKVFLLSELLKELYSHRPLPF